MSLLVQTKSLGKLDYDTKLPHVELAKKLRKRGELVLFKATVFIYT